MAKLFYTLKETCAKLNKSPEEVSQMVAEGKLREFRDHEDQLMFKIQEVDLMSGDSAGSMELDLGSAISATDGDSFELDLSDGDEPKAGSARSASPVGPGHDAAGADDGLTLELDLDGDAPAPGKSSSAPRPTTPPATAKDAGGSAAPFELDLDLDDAPAQKPAAKSGAGSPKAPAADELTLELDLGEEPAPSRSASKSALPADSVGSVAAAKAASGGGEGVSLEGSNVGASPDGSSISDRIGIDGVSSGSGLMDLTNESESSSIGAALMDEAFSSDEAGDIPANASGIFGGSEGGESGADMAAVGAVAGAAAATAATAGKSKGKGSAPIFTSGPASAAEAYSGSWSGLGVGLLLPASLGLGAAASMVVAKALGAPPELALLYAKDWLMYTGVFAGVIAVSGVIGFFVGKATE